MSKKLFVTLTIAIPDDPFTAAHVYTAMQPAWEKLLEALKESGTEYDAKFSELEQRTRAARKPRKRRQQPDNGLSLDEIKTIGDYLAEKDAAP